MEAGCVVGGVSVRCSRFGGRQFVFFSLGVISWTSSSGGELVVCLCLSVYFAQKGGNFESALPASRPACDCP
jgi:hypothetical protein